MIIYFYYGALIGPELHWFLTKLRYHSRQCGVERLQAPRPRRKHPRNTDPRQRPTAASRAESDPQRTPPGNPPPQRANCHRLPPAVRQDVPHPLRLGHLPPPIASLFHPSPPQLVCHKTFRSSASATSPPSAAPPPTLPFASIGSGSLAYDYFTSSSRKAWSSLSM